MGYRNLTRLNWQRTRGDRRNRTGHGASQCTCWRWKSGERLANTTSKTYNKSETTGRTSGPAMNFISECSNSAQNTQILPWGRRITGSSVNFCVNAWSL